MQEAIYARDAAFGGCLRRIPEFPFSLSNDVVRVMRELLNR